MNLPIKLISVDLNSRLRGWITDTGTFIADFYDDCTLYIVHGKCIGIDDERKYFDPILIDKSDIKLQFGKEIINLDLAMDLSLAVGAALETKR